VSAPVQHQATCVAIGGRGILIEGPPGAGKTGLALALIDRGASLVGDDGILLAPRANTLWALPHPRTRGLVEIRNVGLLTFACAEAEIALRLLLDPDAPRFVERAAATRMAGIAVPTLAFDPRIAPAALRAELALRAHGLPGGGTGPD